jgi:hypothetical protein
MGKHTEFVTNRREERSEGGAERKMPRTTGQNVWTGVMCVHSFSGRDEGRQYLLLVKKDTHHSATHVQVLPSN